MLAIGKYRAIVLTISLFVVMDLVILAVDSFSLSNSQSNSKAAHVTQNQISLAKDLYANLLLLEKEVGDRGQIRPVLADLQKTMADFNKVMTDFSAGNSIQIESQSSLDSSAVVTEETKALMQQIRTLWTPVYDNINYLGTVQSADNLERQIPGIKNTLDAAIPEIVQRLEQLTTGFNTAQRSSVTLSRNLQAITFLLSLGVVLGIIFIFIQQLIKEDEAHDIALKETEEILNNVDEGLFLLDQEMRIQKQRSSALEPMFGNRNLNQMTLRQLLTNLVPEKTIELTEDYVLLLLKNRVNENLVDSLNPLDELELNIDKGNGLYDNKYLSFKFHRSYREGVVNHLLVTITDITELVKLRKELDSLKDDADMQVDMIQKIIHVEPHLVTNFIVETRSALNSINEVLKERSMNVIDFKEKLDSIKQLAHKIKGDAASLELDNFSRFAHELEDLIEPLKQKPQISGTDFLPLTLKLNRFMDYLDMTDKLIAATPKSLPTSTLPVTTQWDRLNSLTSEVAKSLDKKVLLDTANFDTSLIPAEYSELVKDILIQLIRNAIVHGIESSLDRKKMGKEVTGRIKLSFDQDGSEFSLKILDDGAGINMDKIRDSALRKNRMTQEQMNKLAPAQVMSLIFEPGFTTQNTVNEHAGRGVGMDLVKSKVKAVGGKIKIASSSGKHCQFDIRLPLVSSQTNSITKPDTLRNSAMSA